MKFLTRLCRLILGSVFVFSGFLKLIDPIGTSLVINEYFGAFHLGFLGFAAVPAAVGLAMIEFMVGVSALVRLRVRFMAWITLVMMSLFTLVTLYLAVFNPISDCGCFGEALHLTNWQTFFKNLVLLPCAVMIFVCRHSIAEFEHPVAEWVFMLVFAVFGAAVMHYVSHECPLMEFSSLQIGNDIKPGPEAGTDSYVTTFIYEKDGVQREFSLENLPDSTWSFVDAVTVGPEKGADSSDADFYVENVTGTDITPDILSRRKLLLLSVYDTDRFFSKHSQDDIENLRLRAYEDGFDFMTVASMLYGTDASLAAGDGACADESLCTDPLACDSFPGLADRKLLMTLNRSNGGLTYLDEGRIIRKWAAPAVLGHDIFFSSVSDSELALLEASSRQRSAVMMSVIALLLLYLIKLIIFRFMKRRQ